MAKAKVQSSKAFVQFNPLGETAAPVPEVEQLSYWLRGPFMRFGLERLNVGPFSAAVIAFVVYWLLPGMLSLTEGTSFSKEIMASLGRDWLPLDMKIPLLENWFAWFASRQKFSGVSEIPYLSDRTHFVFSTLVAAGAASFVSIVRAMPRQIESVQKSGSLTISASQLRMRYDQGRLHSYSVWKSAICVMAAVFTFVVFRYMSTQQSTLNWWGNRSHGLSGLIFCFSAALMVFWGLRSLFAVVDASKFVASLATNVGGYRPFHPDGCAGFGPVGTIILHFWAYGIFLVLANIVTLSSGYLEIERTPITWFISLLGTLFLPALAIVPLLRFRNSMLRAKIGVIAPLEHQINDVLEKIRSTTDRRETATKLMERFDGLTSIHEALLKGNHWPISRVPLFGAISLNLLQSFLLLREFYEKIILAAI